MVAILSIDPRTTHEQRDQYLYKMQHAFANAFLDLFVTDENGRAKDPRVIDYYGQEEPIELGPDENMHNIMIERMAKLAERRGYLLGKGIMSSKEIGINRESDSKREKLHAESVRSAFEVYCCNSAFSALHDFEHVDRVLYRERIFPQSQPMWICREMYPACSCGLKL